MNAKLIILIDNKTSNVTVENRTTYVRVNCDYNYYIKESIENIADLINN